MVDFSKCCLETLSPLWISTELGDPWTRLLAAADRLRLRTRIVCFCYTNTILGKFLPLSILFFSFKNGLKNTNKDFLKCYYFFDFVIIHFDAKSGLKITAYLKYIQGFTWNLSKCHCLRFIKFLLVNVLLIYELSMTIDLQVVVMEKLIFKWWFFTRNISVQWNLKWNPACPKVSRPCHC